jgi:anthranilate/para-aminobenzoate synthase component I
VTSSVRRSAPNEAIVVDAPAAHPAVARVFAHAAQDRSLVALRAGSTVYLGLRGEIRACEDDPRAGLAAFSEGLDRSRLADARDPRALRAYGWLAYDALRGDEPESERDARPRGDRAPRAFLQAIDAYVRVDAAGEVTIGGDVGAARALSARLREPVEPEAIAPCVTESRTDRATHRAQLETVREWILDGEVYLVNVARICHARAGLSDPQVAARVLRARAPYSALLRAPDVTVGAMSMERALRWSPEGELETRPIKGTRPRADDPSRDDALARELAASPKERAENVMAVDVHRNDLGRVAAVGSVRVPALCVVERHAFVHHLVSTVRAKTREGVSARELLDATLPVGSVTGAPKRAAMRAIATLESERRGLYTGVYGALFGDGALDLSVAIRTIVVDHDGAHYGSGGGIVIDSEPDHEWTELAWKERALAGR